MRNQLTVSWFFCMKKYKKYSEFIDNPLVVTLIAKLFKINFAVK